ncbi:cytidylyltransferase domain-containing protein [Flavobacterium sp.]|uniref:acylneuraminate cytidylyltransferase family protein n=1 Tax=Flavobacterium sp. TaxID=239 RepID=UPI0039E36CD8
MGKTIAIIPARGGSKRLPGKNTKELNGLPLLAHSILYAQAHPELIDDIYVSTDDAEIKAVALRFGAKVIDRPVAISGDLEPTVSALKHVISHVSADTIVLLQPTNPLRPTGLLSEALAIFRENNCDSLFTVTRSHHKLGRIVHERFRPFNYKPGQRSQDLEPLYFENGLLYISTRKLILADTIMSPDAFPLEVNHPFASVDIDTQQDFDFAQYLLKQTP